jgi:hypothetical protein
MSLDQVARQFVVDEEIADERLERLIQKLLPFCVVSKTGAVRISASGLSGKDQMKLVLSARLAASRLKESPIRADVSAEEACAYKNQVVARMKECADDGFADRVERGMYRARQHKLDGFIDELAEGVAKRGQK